MASETLTTSTTVSMLTLPTEEEAGRPRTASTLSRVFKRDPDEANPVRRVSAAQAPHLSTLYPEHPRFMDDPPLKYHPLCEFSFLSKLAQLTLAVMCLGLHTEAMKLIEQNITTQTFPLVVCAAYMIIIPVILLSCVLGQKMPELLIRIFSLLGGILFFVSSLLLVVQWVTFHEFWEHPDADSYADDSDVADFVTSNESRVKIMLTECAFSMINSFLFFADVVMSVKRTLSFL